MKVINCASFATIMAGLSLPALSAPLFTYDFPGDPGSGLAASQTATQPSGATFGDFTRVNVNANAGANRFNSTAWNTTATLDTGEYVQFSFTVNPLFSGSITDISFVQDGSNTVADEYDVRYSTNGFTSFVSRGSDTVTTSDSSEVWDFADLAVSAGDTVTFRFFVFGDTQADGSGVPAAGGTWSLDNVVVNGNLTAVPEPGTLALAGWGCWRW